MRPNKQVNLTCQKTHLDKFLLLNRIMNLIKVILVKFETFQVLKDDIWPNPLQYYLRSPEINGISDDSSDESDGGMDDSVVVVGDDDDDDEGIEKLKEKGPHKKQIL